MVIGIEGNVHVGKTTYIKNNFHNYNIIKEIEFKKDLNCYNRQLFYIYQEALKKEKLTKNTVLDRTIISTAIYSFNNNSLSVLEKKHIKKIIKRKLLNNDFIVPKYIYNIIYPYKLIILNHDKLYKKKGTEEFLIDYDYYIKYNLFFSNRYGCIKKIISNDNYRQIISYNNSLFKLITKDIKINSKVLVDGICFQNKFEICINQTKLKYISMEQIPRKSKRKMNLILEKIDVLNKNNILLNRSFLMEISYLLYRKKICQSTKLKIINQIMSKAYLNKYITKIIYLNLKDKTINDDYLSKELHFYNYLNEKLSSLSNIYIIDTFKSPEEIQKNIENLKEKPLLLIDLFYEIKEGIIKGEI